MFPDFRRSPGFRVPRCPLYKTWSKSSRKTTATSLGINTVHFPPGIVGNVWPHIPGIRRHAIEDTTSEHRSAGLLNYLANSHCSHETRSGPDLALEPDC